MDLSRVANLASNSHFSNPCSFRDKTFLMIFSKIKLKLKLKSSKLFKISILLLEIVRVLSGGCESWLLKSWPLNMAAQIRAVFEIWRFLWFFQKIFKNLNFKIFRNVEDLNPVVGYCEGALKGCKACLWIWLLNFVEFSRLGVFLDLFKFFQKT